MVHITSASALNAFVSLLGYYAAAAIVDDPDIGRLALQQTGFVITGTLFMLCGWLNDRISSSWLIVMYFGSSFFGQCGPNCTTFLIPAEVFPTNMRGEFFILLILSFMSQSNIDCFLVCNMLHQQCAMAYLRLRVNWVHSLHQYSSTLWARRTCSYSADTPASLLSSLHSYAYQRPQH